MRREFIRVFLSFVVPLNQAGRTTIYERCCTDFIRYGEQRGIHSNLRNINNYRAKKY